MEHLYQKLQEYSKSSMYGFHMPGHKRKPLLHHCYEIDITEIDGFDDMHHPEGLLKEFQSYMREVYNTKGSYFLINGSTGGILAAISAGVEIGGELLAARNCHKSVYNAALLRNLKLHYIYPQYDTNWGFFSTISPEDVEKSMQKYPSCKAVVVVSPTYEGVVSDISAISEVVHRYGGILIVDEAHGAHFPYLETFPKSAVDCGADIVIQSVHKTLPALTQTALLHVCGSKELQKKVEQYLSIYQSSSPSYVFLSSIEECVLWMETHKDTVGKAYTMELGSLRQNIAGLQRIELYEPAYDSVSHNQWNASLSCTRDNLAENQQHSSVTGDMAGHRQILTGKTSEKGADYDQGKLVLRVRNMENSGTWLYKRLLNEYQIQLEMCLPGYCIAMTSVMDDQLAFARLFQALSCLDESLVSAQDSQKDMTGTAACRGAQESICLRQALENESVYTIYEAEQLPGEEVLLEECEGRVSLETAYVYPPGIPIIVAGERFSKKCVHVLQQYRQYGFEIRGIRSGCQAYKIWVSKK